ncbi:hypothetical protein NBRC116601_02250 [Cognatishimia sp. WU-CL00825]|uniref:hypothetical protein n=1 Tax=Cognatishimia sp. WU-CL00825 TaxID=3127658 RepID=UPI0031086542
MIAHNELNSDLKKIQRLIHRKFGIDSDDLPKAMRKIGRRLPKSAHKNAKILHTSLQKTAHPKLIMQVNQVETLTAVEALLTTLQAYDPKERRWGLILNTLASMAFNLLLVFGIFVVVLVWRGYL